MNIASLRQVFQLLGAWGAEPDDELMGELCESLSSRKDLVIYEQLVKWMWRLPQSVLTKNLAQRIRVALPTTRLYSRLGDVCRTALYAWQSPPRRIRNRMSVPDDCPVAALRPLAELAYYQKLSGERIRLPSSLDKFIFAATRRTREMESLKRLVADRPNDQVQSRLDYLNLSLIHI